MEPTNLAKKVRDEFKDSIKKSLECTPEYKIDLVLDNVDSEEDYCEAYVLRSVDPITGWVIDPAIGYIRITNNRVYKFFQIEN